MEENTNAFEPGQPEFSGFDPFPKPRLFPMQWDLSEMMGENAPARQLPESSAWHEPFPELRTFPGGWNLA